MPRPVAIEEARAVANIPGDITACRKVNRKAGAQGVALVVIEEEEICRCREIRQSAGDRALSLCVLVRIGEIELAPFEELWRACRKLEGTCARALDSEGKEDVRVAERIVIEKV